MRDVLKKAENRYVFGVDLSLLTDIPKSMAEYCLAAREEEEGKAFTPGRFSALLAKAVVIVQIQESDNTEQIVKENAALFGTSAETIDTLPDTQKHILLKLLKNADYTKTAPEDVFAEKLLTSRAAAAESMSEMRYIIESHAAAFGTDVSQGSDYMTIREDKRISVFGYMLSDSENFTSYADVKNAFDAAVQKVKKESVKNSGSSGNSGSGSSSGGRKTNVVLPRQTDTSTEKDNQTEVFSDIQESYAKEYIRQLCDQKVLNGFPDGTFRPNESVTRAEFAKMLCILLNLSGGNAAFSDVNTSDWFYSYVAACAQKGIVNGFEGKFMPQNTITREDCAVMVCRALELAEAGTVTNFLDDEAISDYAKGAVSALSDKKILIGDNGFFRAKDNLKRGDAAIILCKLTEALS